VRGFFQSMKGSLSVLSAEPTQDVSVLQDTGNLLAIMQNGAFYKVAEPLRAT